MKAALIKMRLVKLLMQKPPLDSADAWAHALSLLEAESGCASQSQQLNLLHDAIQELVPRLPEYKTVRMSLLALLEYCRDRYPVETDIWIEIWLERACAVASRAQFRRWLVRWLHDSKLQSRWTKALQAALVSTENPTEKDQETKRLLLQMLHRLKDTADDQVAEEDAATQVQAITTVEELLDFYWHHASALATSALLCAAKMSALLDSTARVSSTVSVRLRWARVTKPLLFESLVRHATALKALPSSVNLRLSAELQAVMDCVSPLQLTRLQDQHQRTTAALKSAYRHGVRHLYQSNGAVLRKSLDDHALRQLLAQWSPQIKAQLVADVANDLALVPPYLVPAVFTPLSVYLSALLLSEATEERDPGAEAELVVAVNALFKLLKRASNGIICYLVLGIVLQSTIAQHEVWRRVPGLFASVVQSLSECLALETNHERNWIVAMTLQQFLFECDADVLRMNCSQIKGFVPQELERLAHARLH